MSYSSFPRRIGNGGPSPPLNFKFYGNAHDLMEPFVSRSAQSASPPFAAQELWSMASDPSSPSAPNTALIVDDNELNLKLLNDLLEYHRYTVVTTRFGREALRLARQYKRDETGGYSATRHPRESRQLVASRLTRKRAQFPSLPPLRLQCRATRPTSSRPDVMQAERWTRP